MYYFYCFHKNEKVIPSDTDTSSKGKPRINILQSISKLSLQHYVTKIKPNRSDLSYRVAELTINPKLDQNNIKQNAMYLEAAARDLMVHRINHVHRTPVNMAEFQSPGLEIT
jgi:hypothetical protein